MEKPLKNPPITSWVITKETFYEEGERGRGVFAHETLKGYIPPELIPVTTSTGRKLLLIDAGSNINGVVKEKSNGEVEAVNIVADHKIMKNPLDAMWWVETSYHKLYHKAQEEKLENKIKRAISIARMDNKVE